MQNRDQAIGYIVYALLKWGVSMVDIQKVVKVIEDNESVDRVYSNYDNFKLLEVYASGVIYYYAPYHYNDDGDKINISSILNWAFNDYTVEEAGEMYQDIINLLEHGPMRFNVYI
ncbi:hypothetical protein [Bacillus sp. Hm123]|uniref:hypothetical protein n=1 Tax=Bacillus sp. Hm123 TaxID=3450745 RepID=UPI003F4315EA